MLVYAWKIFHENAIKMGSIIPSDKASSAKTSRNHHHLASSHKTQWKHLVFISERVWCIHVWRTPFSLVPIHRTVHHKNESWTDGNPLSRKVQMCSCVKCTRVSGTLSLMVSKWTQWIQTNKDDQLFQCRIGIVLIILPLLICSSATHWYIACPACAGLFSN